MAASPLRTLGIAIEAAERQRDMARKQMLQARQGLQGAQAQLDQLQSYAQETDQRWGVQENAILQPVTLGNHYQFMGRLFQAMTLQDKVIAQHQARLKKCEEALLAAELRLTSLRKLVERRQQEMALVQMRLEQKQTDERASRQQRPAMDSY